MNCYLNKHPYKNIEALIVEDEIDMCVLLTGILRKKNVHTAYVNSIHEAEDALSKRSPELLLLDNNLPDGYGVDFIHYVKDTYPLTRIVMISADDTTFNKNKALKAGADCFIGKPFTTASIHHAIETALAAKN